MNTLTYTKKRVAATVEKVLRSALENANYLSTEKGVDVDVDNLFVKRAVANDGPRMKRIRPAPMGRAYRYQRRMAHIEIALEEKQSGNGAATTTSTAPAAGAAPAGTKRRMPAKKAARKMGAKKSAAKKTPAKKGGR